MGLPDSRVRHGQDRPVDPLAHMRRVSGLEPRRRYACDTVL